MNISAQDFDRIVEDVWSKLLTVIPEELKAHFGKIRTIIEDQATAEQIHELGFPPLTDPLEICGMNVGVPVTEESVSEPTLFPSQVFLFRKALLAQVDYDGSPEAMADLREEIAVTLLHEIGHFFGLEEEDLDRLGFA